MIDVQEIFKYKAVNLKKLQAYGFFERSSLYIKDISIMNGQFNLQVIVSVNGAVSYKVIENSLNEEYVLVNVQSANGAFIGEVRAECEKVLIDIAEKCFVTDILQSEQTKRIINAISLQFGAAPEFLWEKHPDCAAFRRKDNSKWFAIIMSIDGNKIGRVGYGDVEIMDMKAEPEVVSELIKKENYYPAYHMNKTHWFTVCLNGSIPDDVLLQLLSLSYQISKK